METLAPAIVEMRPSETSLAFRAAEQSLDLISKLAQDPECNPERLDRFLQIQADQQAKIARQQFNMALAAFQAEAPPVIKTSQIMDHRSRQVRGTYADLGAIKQQVGPIMAKYGLSDRYDATYENNRVTVICTLAHSGGHESTSTYVCQTDTSGNKNDPQAVGSSLTYGRRYSLSMALGLTFVGEDDDAGAAQGRKPNKVDQRLAQAQSQPPRQAPPAEDDGARNDRAMAAVQAKLGAEGVEDFEITEALNRLNDKGPKLAEWTDAPTKVLEWAATPKGWAKLAKVIFSMRQRI